MTVPILILANESEPRKVIGSTTLLSSQQKPSLFWLLGVGQFRWDWILAMVIGGGTAALFAAYTCKRVQPRLLGALVGLILVLTNLRTIASLLF